MQINSANVQVTVKGINNQVFALADIMLAGTIAIEKCTVTSKENGWKAENFWYKISVANCNVKEVFERFAFSGQSAHVKGQDAIRALKKDEVKSGLTYNMREWLDAERVTPTIVGQPKLVEQVKALHEAGLDRDTIVGIMAKIVKQETAEELVDAILAAIE